MYKIPMIAKDGLGRGLNHNPPAKQIHLSQIHSSVTYFSVGLFSLEASLDVNATEASSSATSTMV